MKIAYIDPGLSCRQGHNAAMVEEFDQALVDDHGHQVTYYCGAGVDAGEFGDLRGTLAPTFRIDGYARVSSEDLFETQRFGRIEAAIMADLDAAPQLGDCDAILMPTAYPLHLHALAQRLPALAARRVVLGMLLPAAFWADEADAQGRIGELFAQGIGSVHASADLFAYSETGNFVCAGDTLRLATLLPPLARARAAQVQRLAQDAPAQDDGDDDRPLVLGYFGSPFLGKGFGALFEAAQALARAGIVPPLQLRIRLPAGHEPVCRQFNALGAWIDATSRQTDNEAYLQEMAGVDAVCAFYSPQFYATKMSGIIPEAISLGKPLLVSDACEAIHDFLERHAPGSFVSGSFDVPTLQAVLMLDRRHWTRPAACARQHAPLMQRLKDMDRYLSVCGLA